MFGLNEKEIEYLRKCSSDIKSAIDKNNLLMVQLEIGTYLISEDCMYYDSDGQNWYTEKGKYVQSLYDKILDWKYSQNGA
jgi:hypothetical protein